VKKRLYSPDGGDEIYSFEEAALEKWRQQRYDLVIPLAQQAIEQNPRAIRAHRILAKSLFKCRRYRDGFQATWKYLFAPVFPHDHPIVHKMLSKNVVEAPDSCGNGESGDE
jgi:hypothetical protein